MYLRPLVTNIKTESAAAITVLGIIHCSVFYLKLYPILCVCPYVTGNTLWLRIEPNRLMLSIGLWRLYIYITVTILDIIHCRVFSLKLNWTLQVCMYITVNTLCVLTEPNMLMLSIGLWRWYINITITILDIIHLPVFYLKQRFGDWIRSPSSGWTFSVGPSR
jgi:hypothetical protein